MSDIETKDEHEAQKLDDAGHLDDAGQAVEFFGARIMPNGAMQIVQTTYYPDAVDAKGNAAPLGRPESGLLPLDSDEVMAALAAGNISEIE